MYAIRVTRHFYGPNYTKSYATDDRGERATYQTRKTAVEAMRELDDGPYELGHNEYSRPTYRVVRVRAEG